MNPRSHSSSCGRWPHQHLPLASFLALVLLLAPPAQTQSAPSQNQRQQVSNATCELAEGFDDINTLTAFGWFRRNNSTPLAATGWSQGYPLNFYAQAGLSNSYIAADYNNAGACGTISNWLVTPPLTLQNGARFTFYTRTWDYPEFPDRLQVRMSTNGESTEVGTTPTDVGDFATLLLDIDPYYVASGYPNFWRQYTVTITGLSQPTTGRIAFRYFVENSGPAGSGGDYIGIDTVRYTCTPAAPTPTPSPTATPSPSPSPSPSPTPVPCAFGEPSVIFSQDFEPFLQLPPGWVATNASGTYPPWEITRCGVPLPAAYSQTNAASIDCSNSISDKRLDSPPIPISSSGALLRFRNNYKLSATSGILSPPVGFDGGVLEISMNGGAFTDIVAAGGSFVSGGYTAVISSNYGSPIAGRMAWSGISPGFVETAVNLPPTAAGQTVVLRWRLGSDQNIDSEGWRIDDVRVTDCIPPGPTPTPSPSPSPSVTPTPTATPSPTPTPTPSVTPTPTPSPTPGSKVAISVKPDAVSVSAGSDIGFHLSLSNTATVDVTGVAVTDVLPAAKGLAWALEKATTDAGWQLLGAPPNQVLFYTAAALPAQGNTSAHVFTTTTAENCAVFTNTASFTTANGGSGSASASTAVVCAQSGYK
jgi:uncharacterized repeat protein (TIGR01451 family)